MLLVQRWLLRHSMHGHRRVQPRTRWLVPKWRADVVRERLLIARARLLGAEDVGEERRDRLVPGGAGPHTQRHRWRFTVKIMCFLSIPRAGYSTEFSELV